MDRLVRIFHGGSVNEHGEFENMLEDVQVFDRPPSFKDLVDVVSKHSWGKVQFHLGALFNTYTRGEVTTQRYTEQP